MHTVVAYLTRVIKGNLGMHRKGLGGMDTMDNACIGAKSVWTHPLGKKHNQRLCA